MVPQALGQQCLEAPVPGDRLKIAAFVPGLRLSGRIRRAGEACFMMPA